MIAYRARLTMVAAVLALAARVASAQDDPYEKYVKTSKDFAAVKQDKAWCLKAFPSWTYMPWTYQWRIGYADESGKWSLENGYNGAFIDWDHVGDDKSKTGKLDWINKFHLRFYVDHTAAKRYLHLWDGGEMTPHAQEVHGGGVRVKPVNAAMADELKSFIRKHISAVKGSPYRAAYALDDEISWGHFTHPCMWCVTDDKDAYANWLKEIYGPAAPQRTGWVTYDAIWRKLKTWRVIDFDVSQLMDQWTFNDSYWNNFIGDLVEYANSVDPDTPCGFVGGQAPNAFGGYDYAKLMRKVQFIKSYNIGSSQAIIRSFNPAGAIPSVTTHFHKSLDDSIWQTWYYMAHGNRGFIGWVEGWFDGEQPKDFHAKLASHYREAGSKIGPLVAGATWMHDGVAIYYSHASIQLGWIMDAESHGRTWINRNGDERLGGSHLVRKAWENMLRDEGLQYSFLSYADVIRNGIPSEYKVIILPACLCLSDAEARRIAEFVRAGGTVIADYMPGLWDQHGKGRAEGGALDELFGVRHDPKMRAADVFGGKLWCEADQDVNFDYKTYQELLTKKSACVKDASGFNRVVRAAGFPVDHVNQAAQQLVVISGAGGVTSAPAGAGQGTAVLMNLSPQWYNAYRVAGFDAAARRDVFMKHVRDAGCRRWVSLKGAGAREFGYEITYWRKDGRTILFVVSNPEVAASSTGGGNAVGLKSETIPVTLEFSAAVKNVRDERAGKELGEGKEFTFDWPMNQAIVVSFEGAPPKQVGDPAPP